METIIIVLINLITENINFRYETQPIKIYNYTIYNENIESIKTYISNIKNIKDFANPILEPIFSKGFHKLYKMIEFMNNEELFESNEQIKSFFIAQFIIINQVFGDANHRTAIYYLREYSEFDKEQIDNIIIFIDKIHKYDGELKRYELWNFNNEDGFYYPDFAKILSYKII
jgi:hypothetical protein